MKLHHRDIDALVQLIDDPDYRVSNVATQKLSSIGKEAIPFLEKKLDLASTPQEIKEVLNLSDQIRFNDSYNEMKKWLANDDKDLNQAIKLIADCQFEGFDSNAYDEGLDVLVNETWKELNPRQTSFEVINTINTLFFDWYKFQTSEMDVLPHHSFPHVVIEDRMGTSFGIALLYTVLAHKLNIPIYMVVLPGRCFMVHLNHYKNKLSYSNYFDGSDAQFFIDPLDQCRIKPFIEVEQEISLFKEYNPTILEPSPHSYVVKCYLQELILSYHTWKGNTHKTQKLEELLTLF